MVDVFADARRLVSAREVAELNGLRPDRSGFIVCPLHREKTASLKLYENGSWHCFGCNRGGSSIDLVAALYDLSPLDAVKKLDTDFHLALPLDRQQTPQERTEAARAAAKRQELSDTAKAFEAWRGAMLDKLTAVFRMAHLTMKAIETPADLDRLTDAQALAIREQAYIEYLSDLLLSGNMEDMMQIFRERGQIEQLCEKILNSSRTKSGAA